MATAKKKEQAQGLVCPNCSGVVPVAEGIRIVKCPYCDLYSMVQGDRGVYRWQVDRRIDRTQAESAIRESWSGVRKANDLARSATLDELLLVYLPFWHMEATVAGWMFGRVRKDEDSTKPAESFVFSPMEWNDAALDVSEFGVHRIAVSRDALKPFDSEHLHAEGMVFEPTESRAEAAKQAERHFIFRGRSQTGQTTTFSEELALLEPRFSIIYYPIWVGRYSYRNRTYQMAVDGVSGDIMYGKAPGSTLFRAAALVAGLALGNLVLVNGTILAGAAAASDDDGGLGILLLPLIIGLSIILSGYRLFRYGEEVEDKPSEHQPQDARSGLSTLVLDLDDLPKLVKSGQTLFSEMISSPPDDGKTPLVWSEDKS